MIVFNIIISRGYKSTIPNLCEKLKRYNRMKRHRNNYKFVGNIEEQLPSILSDLVKAKLIQHDTKYGWSSKKYSIDYPENLPSCTTFLKKNDDSDFDSSDGELD